MSRPFVYAALVFLVLSLLLIWVPLLNYLGFEFSFAIALAVPFLVGIPAIGMIRSQLPLPREGNAAGYHRAAGRALREGLTILLVPAGVATLNLFFVRNCSYGEGLLFYLLLPVVTAIWSVALACFCALATRRAILWYAAAVLGCLLYPLYIGYSSPQIFSYDFVYGFFPGFSYDEVLTITPTLLLFRLITLLAALFLFAESEYIARGAAEARNSVATPGETAAVPPGPIAALFSRKQLRVWMALLGLLVMLAWLFRVPLGFETTSASLAERLGSERSTGHFRIVYSGQSISPGETGWIAALHEYRCAQVEAALQLRFHGRITSYLYPDGETKLQLIGTKTTNIAKPWRREVHIEQNSVEGTLKHELVHVLAGEFGMPVIRAHYHIGLVEGLAMAVDADFGNRTLDEYAAAMRTFNLVTDPGRLITPLGFATHASTVSYVLMGSFCKYLIDRYGIVLFKQLYGGKPPDVVYGKSYGGLVEEWQTRLSRIDVPESWRKHVEYYFNRPSIFAKECAREVAKLNEKGYKDLAGQRAAAAADDFSAALRTSWNSDSYAGLVRASFSAARYDTVVQLIDARRADSVSRPGLIGLNLLYGDALWRRGDVPAARKAYEELLSYDLSEGFDEAASIRLEALGDTLLRAALPEYFTGSLTDTSALRMLDSLRQRTSARLVPYLEGRVSIRLRRYKEAIGFLEGMDARRPARGGQGTDLFSSPVLNARREQMLGEASFRLKAFQDARAHFWRSLNFITNRSSVNRVEDWLERCQWFENNAARYIGSAQ